MRRFNRLERPLCVLTVARRFKISVEMSQSSSSFTACASVKVWGACEITEKDRFRRIDGSGLLQRAARNISGSVNAAGRHSETTICLFKRTEPLHLPVRRRERCMMRFRSASQCVKEDAVLRMPQGRHGSGRRCKTRLPGRGVIRAQAESPAIRENEPGNR